MRPVRWSTSYLLRCPFGISIVTSNSTLLLRRACAAPPSVTYDEGRGRSEVRAVRGGWTGRRTSLVAAGAALVLAGGAAAALVLPGDVARVLPHASPSPDATRPPLFPAESAGVVPTSTGVARALAPGLKDAALGGHVAISVLDAATGRPVLETSSREVVLPASTAKIATAVAALTALPADLRLTTRVVAGPAAGDVVLVGGGDPTLAGPFTRPGYPSPARLADLAARVKAELGTTAVRRGGGGRRPYPRPPLRPGRGAAVGPHGGRGAGLGRGGG